MAIEITKITNATLAEFAKEADKDGNGFVDEYEKDNLRSIFDNKMKDVSSKLYRTKMTKAEKKEDSDATKVFGTILGGLIGTGIGAAIKKSPKALLPVVLGLTCAAGAFLGIRSLAKSKYDKPISAAQQEVDKYNQLKKELNQLLKDDSEAEEAYKLKLKQDEETETYGNYTVHSNKYVSAYGENGTMETYSDGSRSLYIEKTGGFEYKEYYPNGKLKFEREESGFDNGYNWVSSGATYTIYDENGKVLYDDSWAVQETDGADEYDEYDNKERPTYICGLGIRYEYDDVNKTVTETSSLGTIVYEMDDEGRADEYQIISHKYVGESGREIDVLNGGLEKLYKELHIRRTKE